MVTEEGQAVQRFERLQFKRLTKGAKPRGLTIFYCGDGKGKTTAAVGLAVRARGAGLRVAFLQLMKSERWPSHERAMLKKLGMVVQVLGSGFVGILDDRKPLPEHRAAAHAALAKAKSALGSGRYNVVIADEAVSAVEEGLLKVSDVLSLIRLKPTKVHLVVTGHTRFPAIVRASDLVTEMRNVKHPYKTLNMLAQRGIDF